MRLLARDPVRNKGQGVQMIARQLPKEMPRWGSAGGGRAVKGEHAENVPACRRFGAVADSVIREFLADHSHCGA